METINIYHQYKNTLLFKVVNQLLLHLFDIETLSLGKYLLEYSVEAQLTLPVILLRNQLCKIEEYPKCHSSVVYIRKSFCVTFGKVCYTLATVPRSKANGFSLQKRHVRMTLA